MGGSRQRRAGKELWPGLVAVVTSCMFSVSMLNELPERVAAQWSSAGTPTSWMSPVAFIVLIPLIATVITAAFTLAPTRDSHGDNFALHEGSYWFVGNLILLLLALSNVLTTGYNLGWNVKIQWLNYGMACLFIALGNLLTRVRPNGIFGVRTPWTLSSDRSWRETHRVAGYGMVLHGIVVFVLTPFEPHHMVRMVVSGIAIIGVTSIIYSYIAWKQDPSVT